MTLFELIDISQSISDRIDVQWGFFITVHMALFGGIVYVDRPLKTTEKWVAMVLYTGFSTINYIQLRNQFTLLLFSFDDIHTLAANQPRLALLDYYEKLRTSAAYNHVSFLIAAVHVVMLFIVLGSIISDTEKKDEGTDENPAEGIAQAPGTGPNGESG